jgi:pyruvate/2-oxoglutarate dehydrogenase complex dihydrolipoamide acyltransferase (E2) component
MKSDEIVFGTWLVERGASVTEGNDLFEVEADKASVVFEAEASGVLGEILVTEGSVKEGEVLGYIHAG